MKKLLAQFTKLPSEGGHPELVVLSIMLILGAAAAILWVAIGWPLTVILRGGV